MAVVAFKDTAGMDAKIDDMALCVAESFKERIQSLADGVLESPIEKLFAAGMEAAGRMGAIGKRVRFSTFERAARDEGVINVIPQHDMSDLTGWNYRVDFLLVTFVGGGDIATVLVVECDGYQWHDRTKEEFALERQRNRRLLSAGYPVVSFAGSEVWEAPLGCAIEAANILAGEHNYLSFPLARVQSDNDPATLTDRSKAMQGASE